MKLLGFLCSRTGEADELVEALFFVPIVPRRRSIVCSLAYGLQ